MKMTKLDKWKQDLANKKPTAILILVATAVIGLGAVVGSVGVIWDAGSKFVYYLSEWSRVSEKENQKLADQKQKYFKAKEVADKVFIEILANIRKIDAALNNQSDTSGESLAFQFANHDKWYTGFGIGELDRQIGNFYASLKNSDIGYSAEDWRAIKGQGEDVKRLMSQYFCCSDYYRNSILQTNAVSQDSVVMASPVDATKVSSGVTVGINFDSSCFLNYMSAFNMGENVDK